MNGQANRDKPPYRVPSMEEINALAWNGYHVVSTFSGAGGSCLGYKMAGFRVLYANEFIPAAQETYRLNHPDSYLDTRDIRTVQPHDILSAIGLAIGQIDILDGSPPCAAFSTSGIQEKGWGAIRKYSDTQQRVDDLFFEYIRLLHGLQPKVFIAENVAGLIKGKAKGYFKLILQAMKDCGYQVKAKVLDAQWLGVPQSRNRLFFIGVRNDLHLAPAHPSPLPYAYTVREALPYIHRAVKDTRGQFAVVDMTDRASEAILNNPGHYYVECDLGGTAIGKQWDELEPGKEHPQRFNLKKAHPDLPCPAILAGHGRRSLASVVHPYEKRKFTIAELKRICAFPNDFQLTGSYAQQWERLGRAVPPVMMFHIARTIQAQVLSLCAE